jgi:hypothetical protein
MKVKFLGLLVLVLLFGVVSCQTAPPAEPEPEPIPPPPAVVVDPDAAAPDQASLSNLDAAVRRAENARRLVMDFNGPDYFPDDWRNAESTYNRAQTGRRTATVRDVRESLALFNTAADAFEALAEKTIPRFAQDLENEVLAARNTAVRDGAESIAPAYLWKIDDISIEAMAQYEARDYYTARDTGFMARDGYNLITVGLQAYRFRHEAAAAGAYVHARYYILGIDEVAFDALDLFEARKFAEVDEKARLVRDAYSVLTTGVQTYLIRLELEDRDFVRFDRANIEAADAIAFTALDDFENRDIATATTKVNDVRTRYTRSLGVAWQAYATEAGNAATAERSRALEARANVAVRNDYEAANTIFIQGAQAVQRRDFENAANLYGRARTMFVNVTREALERRRLAEEAIRQAEQRMAESDEAAHRAELIIGGSR